MVRFLRNNCSTDAGSDPQHCANASTATSTSQGKIDLPPIRANGPSDSVKTRPRGIRLVNSIPRLPLDIAGPTLNQLSTYGENESFRVCVQIRTIRGKAKGLHA